MVRLLRNQTRLGLHGGSDLAAFGTGDGTSFDTGRALAVGRNLGAGGGGGGGVNSVQTSAQHL